MPPRGPGVAGPQVERAEHEMGVPILGIDPQRLAQPRPRPLVLAEPPCQAPLRERRLPGRSLRGREPLPVPGEERGAVLEVGHHRAEDRPCPRAGRGLYDAPQVLPEVAVDGLQPRVVPCNRAVDEHGHPSPLGGMPSTRGKSPRQRADQLPGPRRADEHARPNHPEGRHLRKIGAARAIGADDLVVAHVNHEQVGLEAGELAGDLVDDMGVDRDDAGVDDLDLPPRISGPQLRPKLRAEREAGDGNALGRGFTQQDDPDRVGRLAARNPEVERSQVEAPRQEQAGKVGIAPEIPRLAVGNEECRRPAVSGQAQPELKGEKDRNGHADRQRGPVKPQPPGARRL